MKLPISLLVLFLSAGAAAPQDQPAPQKKQQSDVNQKTLQMLTPEQKAHMQEAREYGKDWAQKHPARDSTGMIALPDLGKAMYKGEQGGLYPGGVNTPPPAHLEAGLKMAHKIVPLDADGHPAPRGKIVMISVGMSNTTMKFQTFQKIAAQDRSLNPKLLLVDGAQGGQVAWATANPKMPYWEVLDRRLKVAGVTPNQVQVAWILQANPGPFRAFPAEAKELQGNLVDTLHVMHDKFPNLKIAYLSSRTYGGYATSPLNPEPFAYEGGFSVKWLIADQIAGKPELNYDPANGAVRAPWITWGPYVWADGVKPNRDGLSYTVDDYVPADRTHPSESGRMKVATRLLEFLKSDPTSKSWFLGGG